MVTPSNIAGEARAGGGVGVWRRGIMGAQQGTRNTFVSYACFRKITNVDAYTGI